jgi:ribosome biogenesis GTPase
MMTKQTQDQQNFPLPSESFLGTVIAVQANFYVVRLDGTTQGEISSLLCTRRSLLKKTGQQVMAGDRVWVEQASLADDRGVIVEVLPRKTLLDRPPVANAEQLLLVFALAEPSLEAWQLSRFLVKAESTELEIGLCLNKLDLMEVAEQIAWQERIQTWGYDPVLVSVETEQGFMALLAKLRDRVTIFAGPSGVGKSSLINRLIPSVEQRVNSVSGKLQKGRHTTRHVELFELPTGGLLTDTPGFNQPDLDCPPEALMQYFPEIRHRLAQDHCQFNNCWHRDEPGCGVRGDWERYPHYLKFLEEAIALQTARQQTPDPESSLKLKITQSGQREYEPRLASKRYRRTSRRSDHQTFQELVDHQSIDKLSDEDLEDW